MITIHPTKQSCYGFLLGRIISFGSTSLLIHMHNYVYVLYFLYVKLLRDTLEYLRQKELGTETEAYKYGAVTFAYFVKENVQSGFRFFNMELVRAK